MEQQYIIRERLSGAVNALSISPGGNSVVAAGREILKIYNIHPSGLVEALNLRSGSHFNLNYSSNDVKWGNNATKHKVATAATNGTIILWDLNKVGRKAERVIAEHARAVNRITFQPDNGNILLSASQDGTMKCWDFRDAKSGAKFRFEGKSESVRDVQFNPVNTHEFAAAFETGTIQKWDMRNPRALYDKKVSAHNGPCLTVDWHTNGKWVASGGRDKTIKVWDMTADSRRPVYTIKTMASVARIQWRPGYENEIASCALLTDNRIHMWDIRRPHIAKYTFEEHDTTPTGFVWLNSTEIISASKDKWLIRQHLKGSQQPLTMLRRNGMGWNIQGDVAFTVDQSPRKVFVDDHFMSKPFNDSPRPWKRLNNKSALEEEMNQYIPPQTCAIVHMPLFDYEAFTILAENYVISNANVSLACDINSKLAWKVGRYRTAQTWKIIGMLYGKEGTGILKDQPTTEAQCDVGIALDGDPMIPTMEETGTKDSESFHLNETEDILFTGEEEEEEEEDKDKDKEENEENDEEDDDDLTSILSKEESESVLTKSSSVSLHPTPAFELRIPWKHDSIISDLLQYYIEQGDIQMCVTLYLVLEDYLTIDNDRLEEWFVTYIDLLQRFKLWSTAVAMMKTCKLPVVRERNENDTTIHIACNHCFKLVNATSKGAWACDKCQQLLNPCTICHETVRGLYVWCQGCNHGGHLAHMRDWFTTESECATGCGHRCVLQPFLSTLPLEEP
ncbi:WD40-repeat-containing domain protein [Mycotypha africana]|uniref:WD40-repeat-containing domain protein n=1 Tax=Mycotypha africana TaxID=64632 RepID=UPI00230131B0|nr:WD40-repeat-containing domain protein [Mycotypha africana]KAI8969296.1 WD40-repeat-containing domain protein [Mycotypha africana]